MQGKDGRSLRRQNFHSLFGTLTPNRRLKPEIIVIREILVSSQLPGITLTYGRKWSIA
jgi:hypothetical protein